MNVDMPRLLGDHGIAVITAGKNATPGWINMRCPFCDDKSSHLGWNLSGQYFSCWKCKGHPTKETIAELLGITEDAAFDVMTRYALRPGAMLRKPEAERTRPNRIIVPGTDLQAIHIKYLESRNYDWRQLLSWQLQGTGPLEAGYRKFRIFCPIYHNGRVVSWQGRDITGRSELRWYSCPGDLELRDHKHCLGGEQLVPGDSVALVEGFTSAWRLGPGAVCTFGTAYLAEQVELIKRYRRRFIVMDSEAADPNARLQADLLCHQLSAFPGETLLVELDEGDPGDLPQDEADYLMEKEWGVR